MPYNLLAEDLTCLRTEANNVDDKKIRSKRPPFLPGSWSDAAYRDAVLYLFPRARPRPFFANWDHQFESFTAASYFAALFNLEGCILKKCWIESSMIRAGLILCLHDLLQEDRVWIASLSHFQQGGTVTNLSADMPRSASKARFLVIPCWLADQSDGPMSQNDAGHWVLAIADQQRKCIFWYNTMHSYALANTRSSLATSLHIHGVTSCRFEHVNIRTTDQPEGWECGLAVLECARVFFRERVLAGCATHLDWAASHLCVYWAHATQTPNPSTKEKMRWIARTWTGWIRAELGQLDMSPLRSPEQPNKTYSTSKSYAVTEKIKPNNKKGQTQIPRNHTADTGQGVTTVPVPTMAAALETLVKKRPS